MELRAGSRCRPAALVVLLALASGGAGSAFPVSPAEVAPTPLTVSGGTRSISLAEALTLADGQSLEVRRAGVQTQAARGEEREAVLGWVPSLSASAGISATDGQVQGSFGDFRDVDFRSAAPYGFLRLALNPAETWFSSATASRRAESVADQERAVRRLVLIRVAELYYDLVRQSENRRIARLGVEDSGDLFRIADVLLRQGTGRGDDAERARAQLATAEQRLLDAERRVFVASVNLATALDLDPTIVLDPTPEGAQEQTLVAGEPDEKSILKRALESRPEVAAARRLLEAVRSQRSADVARLAAPTVEAFYRQGATGETYADLSGLRSYGIAASWNISARGFARVRTTATREEEARLAVAQAEQAVRADVLGAWSEVLVGGSRLEKAREARQAAESTLRISQVRYRNGTSPAIETLLAEQQLDQARLSEVAAVVDYNVAQVRLRTQLPPVAPGDLSAPPGSGVHKADGKDRIREGK